MKHLLRRCRYLWSCTGSRRARARWIVEYLIDAYEDVPFEKGWPDWTYAPQWGALNALGRWSCRVWGHDPTADQCGIPAHDYCMVCSQRTPDLAPRRSHGSTF